MKVHYATGITLALKNMKGLLVGGAKRRCHEAGLDKAIVDLNNTLDKAIVDLNNTIRPHLNVVDAISCMERMGPRGGDIVRMDLVMAGGDSGRGGLRRVRRHGARLERKKMRCDT